MTTLASMLVGRTAAQVLSDMLAQAQALGMPSTGWQSQQIPRALFEIESTSQSAVEIARTFVVSGGYLDPAAALPDPSWLYKLAYGFFNLTASPATITAGILQFQSATGIA